ncbi:MAG: hypothetical protein WCO57_04035 [Verrucomicrobiota bacterium]
MTPADIVLMDIRRPGMSGIECVTCLVALGTVRTYIERIYEKLHVYNRTDAVVKFLGQPPAGRRPR